MMEIQDMNKICRTCLSQTDTMQTIFEVKISEEHNIRLIDFVRRLTSIKITRYDNLPNNICIYCVNNLCKAFNFAQMCIHNDTKLKQKLIEKNTLLEIIEDENGLSDSDDYKIDIKVGHEEDKSNYSEIIIIQNSDRENNDYTCISEDNGAIEKVEIKCDENVISAKVKTGQVNDQNDDNRLYACNICRKSFIKEYHLKAHIRIHYKNQEEFICNICGQKFSYLYLLKKHSYKHEDRKPYPCTKCNKGCITAESLRRHMKTHDDNYMKKMHVCSVCSKEFPYPSFLAEHMKNHTGEKPFLCSVCGKGFRQSGTLQYHIRSHTGSRPYICNICDNSFTSPGVLRVHMRRHTDERPYVCDICGMAFRQSTDMKSHRRIHTGDKPILCTICGKRFSSSDEGTLEEEEPSVPRFPKLNKDSLPGFRGCMLTEMKELFFHAHSGSVQPWVMKVKEGEVLKANKSPDLGADGKIRVDQDGRRSEERYYKVALYK